MEVCRFIRIILLYSQTCKCSRSGQYARNHAHSRDVRLNNLICLCSSKLLNRIIAVRRESISRCGVVKAEALTSNQVSSIAHQWVAVCIRAEVSAGQVDKNVRVSYEKT